MTNPNRFLTALPLDLEQDIRSAAYIALDLETTAMTAYSPTEAPTGGRKIGDGRTMKAVLGRAITLTEARPRIRVVSIGLPDGRGMAFDLDKMTPADAGRLFPLPPPARFGSVKIWVLTCRGTTLGLSCQAFFAGCNAGCAHLQALIHACYLHGCGSGAGYQCKPCGAAARLL